MHAAAQPGVERWGTRPTPPMSLTVSSPHTTLCPLPAHYPAQRDVSAILAEERQEADLRKAEMEANKVGAGGAGMEGGGAGSMSGGHCWKHSGTRP